MSSTSRILGYVSQPDSRTCQSACIAKFIGSEDVYSIRADLENMGVPGDPYIMGEYLRPRVNEYKFSATASLNQMSLWLDEGFQLITHGYFSHSGHVVSVVGKQKNAYIIDDPYGEFMASAWIYGQNENGDNMLYSDRLIYATCVVGISQYSAMDFYRSAKLIDKAYGNAWIHRIKN